MDYRLYPWRWFGAPRKIDISQDNAQSQVQRFQKDSKTNNAFVNFYSTLITLLFLLENVLASLVCHPTAQG
jgi:hypothetical protein